MTNAPAAAARINDLHARYRSTRIELMTLINRGLDYTDRFAEVAGQLAAVERELAVLAPADQPWAV